MRKHNMNRKIREDSDRINKVVALCFCKNSCGKKEARSNKIWNPLLMTIVLINWKTTSEVTWAYCRGIILETKNIKVVK